MANEADLALLERGVDAWNAWRRDNSGILLNLSDEDFTGARLSEVDFSQVLLSGANLGAADLSKASLSGAELLGTDLSGANLTEADLSEAHIPMADFVKADLTGANLSGADLNMANLDSANLSKTVLRGANLSGANLNGANLNGADLSGAKLVRTDLMFANLDGTDFSDAIVGATIFGNVDLKDSKGLETCRHVSASVIDHRMLEQADILPVAFLRGCGLPDKLIESLPSLLNLPIQFYSCFISYSNRDDEFAKRLHAGIQDRGVRCWFAPEDMKIGDPVRSTIEEAIRVRDKLVLILSETSINSDWVEHEVDQALEEEERRGESVLFPIRIDEAVMQTKFGWAKRIREAHTPKGRHIGDFTRWKEHNAYQRGLERLLRDLKIKPHNTDN